MSQCVPSWDLDESSAPPRVNLHGHSNSSNSFASAVPSLDEVAELTWENGQLAMHGLGPRVVNKPTVSASPSKYTTWDKPRAGGTLESIVNQATRQPILPNKSAGDAAAIRGGDNHSASKSNLVPWIEHRRGTTANPAASASVTMTMDALVPCNNNNIRRSTDNQEHSSHVLDPASGIGKCMVGSSTRVGSCSGAAAGTTLDGGVGTGHRVVGMSSCRSVSESDTCDGGRDSRQITLDTCEREYFGVASPENTFSGKEYTRTSGDDHDSVCHSRSQRERGDNVVKKKGNGKSSSSTKRSRAAAIHNQSERKRRDKINQRMKTLQKLVPNSSKTDKASMLTEVIEYLKQLQAQVSMMSRMNMSPMMLPLAMQQQLQMSMMAASPMGMGMGMGMAGMGMGTVMDINTISRAAGMMPPAAAAAFMPPVPSWDNPLTGDSLQMPPPPPGPVMPDPALAAFLACQSQPMTMDAYSRLAALYQQFQPPSASGPASASGPKH